MNTPQGSTPSTAAFTCNTCGIKFAGAELQRQHMKTEWHRYNLKRRVAELPSISSELFAEKILLAKQMNNLLLNEDEYGFYVPQRRRNNATGEGVQLTKKYLRRQERLHTRESLLESQPQTTQSRGVEDEDYTAAEPVLQGVVNSRQRAMSNSNASVKSGVSEFSIGNSYHESEALFESGPETVYSESDVTDFDHVVPSESDLASEIESDEDWENEDVAEPEASSITDCFYCGQHNHEIEMNIKHMFSKHGLYIPERSYLVDVIGLLDYINEAVTRDFECIACGFQGKNLESIRQHIRTKGHAKLPYETKEERLAVEEFYNFTIPEEKTLKKTGKKKVAFLETTKDEENTFTDDEPLTPSEDEEEDEGEYDDDVADGGQDNGINDNYTVVQIDRTGVELTLPSGSRIGHRSMARYYKQNLPLGREAKDSEKTLAVVDKRFSAMSLAERSILAEEKESRRVEKQNRQKYERKLKNINAQRHFRDEILGT